MSFPRYLQRKLKFSAVLAICWAASTPGLSADLKNEIAFEKQRGKLLIKIAGRTAATYVYNDPETLRPYFENLKTPDGVQVTRPHPPIDGVDPEDHSTMHPGLWLAFGDISGHDYWRNKARVVHAGFAEEPEVTKGRCRFAVRNRYLGDGAAICEEICRITIVVRPTGYLILWDSTFSSDKAGFYFGDQEEMGLGVRLATPIMVKSGKGGRILDDQARVNEKKIWGKEALWCDYSGPIAGRFAGVTIMPDPDNFRPCRWHVRDYGFMAANPFGWEAFKQGDSSKIKIEKGREFKLRYGILVHSGANSESPDLDAAYKDYLRLRKTTAR